MSRILVGIILAILLLPIAALAWFEFGDVPVAVSDKPFPYERQITGIPLHARIDREIMSAPIQPTEQNLIAGAHIYSERCAFCHGFHGQKSTTGDSMYPDAPQLWETHHNGQVVGVSDDPPGETYWKVYNGIRLTGMPSYKSLLNQTEIWQVTLLLANADKPLPPAALQLLRNEPAATPAEPAAKK